MNAESITDDHRVRRLISNQLDAQGARLAA
jgi:hypothetical protein